MSIGLTEGQTQEIVAFCQIARENGAAISLQELIRLAGIEASEHELASAFALDSTLSTRFLLESGYVLERTRGTVGAAREIVEEEGRRARRAHMNLERANKFGRSLAGGTVLVSVSGANSYLSARDDEDIDFFCVTRTNGLWPFMLKSLVLARIHQLANRDSPELCFSCIMDEEWANRTFRTLQPAIFARDALTAKVITGGAAYHGLLKEASWMRAYFPAFYDIRLHETATHGPAHKTRASSVLLNSLAYYLLGSFLRMKSWALNRRLAKAARRSSIFKTKIGKGHYIYESNRYRSLRMIYQEFVVEGQPTPSGRRGEEGLETVKVITRGRSSGLPHVATVRFAVWEGAYYVMGAGTKSDWYRNALSSKSVKMRRGETVHSADCEEWRDHAFVKRLFTRKYGADIVECWYSGPEIRSLKLTPTVQVLPSEGPSKPNDVELDFQA